MRELPFAGHPTVGTAFVLASLAPERHRADRIVLEEGIGPVSVELERHDGQLKRCAFSAPRLPQRGPPAPRRDELAAMLGLTASQVLDSAEFWSAGVSYLVAPLASVEGLQRCRLDLTVWAGLLAGHEYKHVYPVAQAGAARRGGGVRPGPGRARGPGARAGGRGAGGRRGRNTPPPAP